MAILVKMPLRVQNCGAQGTMHKWEPRTPLGRGTFSGGDNTWACPILLTVDILSLVHKGGNVVASVCHNVAAGVISYRPVWALGRSAPLIRFLISALCIYCLLVYIVCFPTYNNKRICIAP